MTQPASKPATLFDVKPSSSLDDFAPSMLLSMSASQRARHKRFRREVDKADYVAARALARELVGHGTGVATNRISFRQQCPTCGGDDHGRPSVVIDGRDVERLSVSWSHSSGTVAAAVGLKTSVGIDVECASGPQPNEEVLNFLAEEERISVTSAPNQGWAFRNLWVRKEALVKLGMVSLDEALRRPVASIVSAEPTTTVVAWEVLEYEAHVGLAINSA